MQYTSGSTGPSKGVVVSFENLWHNLEAIRRAFRMDANTVSVHWLPPYHDMGLVGTISETVHLGGMAALMPPTAFLQHPERLIAAITRYGATITGGPDFSYRLLADRITPDKLANFDLRSLNVAYSGAERVRPETMHAFLDSFASCGLRPEALFPCYGMAEATLFISGRSGVHLHREAASASSRPDENVETGVVSCGRIDDAEGTLLVVDPDTRLSLPNGVRGEIWLRGPSVAQPVTRPYSGRGRPPVPAYPDPPATLRELALAAGRGACRRLTWRTGTRTTKANPTAAMRSSFLAVRVRPANRHIPHDADGTLPEEWLIAEWPPDQSEPVKYWLSTLPVRTPLKTLVRLAKIRWRIEHDYRELKTGLGVDHFEGRSFVGWHRHVTLTVLAQAFCTLLRLDPKAAAPA
jgi:acyl-CoA synthetase (AMP-forming)/AMP-acid ligase II